MASTLLGVTVPGEDMGESVRRPSQVSDDFRPDGLHVVDDTHISDVLRLAQGGGRRWPSPARGPGQYASASQSWEGLSSNRAAAAAARSPFACQTARLSRRGREEVWLNRRK